MIAPSVRRIVWLVSSTAVLSCGGDTTTPPASGGGPPGVLSPTVTSVAPGSIMVSAQAQAMTVRGTDFDDAPTLILTTPSGGESRLSGAQLVAISRTSISATVVFSAAGTWRAQVLNSNGKLSGAFPFTVSPSTAPDVQSATVALPDGDVTHVVTVTGSNFQPGLSAVFVTSTAELLVPSASITALTDHSFTFQVDYPSHTAPDLYVANPDGQWSPVPVRVTFGSPISAPRITAILPATIGVATVGQVINITGTDFAGGATVTLTLPSGTTRTFAGPQVLIPTAGTLQIFTLLDVQGAWQVRVSNPDGGQADATLTVGPALPDQPQPPVITSYISPVGPTAADTEQTITLQGTNFQTGLSATFTLNGTVLSGRIVSVTSTSLQVAAAFVRSGLWSVSVRNPDGAPSNTVSFQVNPNPFPLPGTLILGASPLPLTTSLSDQVITLTGAGFRENIAASVVPPVGDLSVPIGLFSATFLSSTKVELRGRFDREGIWKLGVVGGLSVISVPVNYPTSPAPSIASLDPDRLYASSQVQVIHIVGDNFQPGLRVLSVGDDSTRQVSPTNMTVDSVTTTSLRLTATLVRAGRLQVQNPDGRVSNVFRFAQQSPPPRLFNSSSVFYVSSSAQLIRLTTNYVQTGATVTLVDSAGKERSVSGVTIALGVGGSIAFNAVIDAAGLWKVTVKNPDSKESNEATFRVYAAPAPTITAFVPATPSVQHASQLLTVQGTGFVAGLHVDMTHSGTPAVAASSFAESQIQNLSPTSFQIPASLFVSGTWNVSVTNPDGQQASRSLIATGTAPAPTISTVGPTGLTTGAIRIVSVTGTGFHLPNTVTVTAPNGKVQLTAVAAVNLTLTSFQFAYAFDQAGTWTVSIRNADGQQSNTMSFVVQ